MENNNEDVANSLSKYSELGNKGTNLALDSANKINEWYAEQLNKISEGEIPSTRLETNIGADEENEVQLEEVERISKIETKVSEYDEIQTDFKSIKKQANARKIQTVAIEEDIYGEDDSFVNNNTQNTNIKSNKKGNTSKKIGTAIKGVKTVNNVTNKVVKSGKNINTAMNEGGLKSLENSSSRIMTKPVKQIGSKAGKKVAKKATYKIAKQTAKVGKKVAVQTTKMVVKITQAVIKMIESIITKLIEMLPEIAPIIIIIVVIAAFCSFFGLGMSEDTKKQYEQYMINIQNEYDKSTVDFYNQGKIVEGAIQGRGMINWKAPLSIVQMLNGNLTFDNAEKKLLDSFKKANLYETITDVNYTYEKEMELTDQYGNKVKVKQNVTETKKVVHNPSLDDYINWCNNNFKEINEYKKKKKLPYDKNQTKFTDGEVEQIKLLYSSNSFFDLFSADFKTKYAYLSVSVGDEQIQAIYDEFLKNAGKRYLMDHSNLSHDNCMDYYDCSSWVIHCLAHTGIARIPNTTASGIYKDYCVPINADDRQPGDLIFLKDTYNTGTPGGISHIGIYVGELTINGETAEWVIDTGGNPEGVKIRKYNNGWWNGSHFYGFGRLKGNN